jgi:hypothetical protein
MLKKFFNKILFRVQQLLFVAETHAEPIALSQFPSHHIGERELSQFMVQ